MDGAVTQSLEVAGDDGVLDHAVGKGLVLALSGSQTLVDIAHVEARCQRQKGGRIVGHASAGDKEAVFLQFFLKRLIVESQELLEGIRAGVAIEDQEVDVRFVFKARGGLQTGDQFLREAGGLPQSGTLGALGAKNTLYGIHQGDEDENEKDGAQGRSQLRKSRGRTDNHDHEAQKNQAVDDLRQQRGFLPEKKAADVPVAEDEKPAQSQQNGDFLPDFADPGQQKPQDEGQGQGKYQGAQQNRESELVDVVGIELQNRIEDHQQGVKVAGELGDAFFHAFSKR